MNSLISSGYTFRTHVPTFLKVDLLSLVCSDQDPNNVHTWHLVVVSLQLPVFCEAQKGELWKLFLGTEMAQKTAGPGEWTKSDSFHAET